MVSRAIADVHRRPIVRWRETKATRITQLNSATCEKWACLTTGSTCALCIYVLVMSTQPLIWCLVEP
ncbi:unnamed protein product [Leptidea sinapis]|uniref:Uncharacterized protein n=1 Tax=Leptidea sinapis TaxID=189913 RepID=A0A5E4QDA1_9NEOP|nr:unnamed protein product [Leptidea sinapis]